MRPLPRIAAMAPYQLAAAGPAGAISLSQNESAFPPSPAALEAGRRAAESAQLYPDPDWTELRQEIAAVHSVPPEAILCGAGSMELIAALVHAYTGPGDAVVASEFGYLFVRTACAQTGATYIAAPERDLAVDPEALLAAVTEATRIVFLCNPGNPTGTRIASSDIVALREQLPAQAMLVVDQAYAEFDAQNHRPVLDLANRGDTVILRTFSKAYGLAGARVGWGLFPPGISAETRKLLNPNNVSGTSQAMAAAAMRDQAHMREVVRATGALRDALSARLRTAGFEVPESHTNFVLVPFADTDTARAAERALHAAGLVPRAMGGYGLGHCLRVTVAGGNAMERLADILEEWT